MALAADPALLLLDGPSEGVMPVPLEGTFDLSARLRRKRATLLLVERNAGLALDLADRAVAPDHGQVAHRAPAAELLASAGVRARHCAA